MIDDLRGALHGTALHMGAARFAGTRHTAHGTRHTAHGTRHTAGGRPSLPQRSTVVIPTSRVLPTTAPESPPPPAATAGGHLTAKVLIATRASN